MKKKLIIGLFLSTALCGSVFAASPMLLNSVSYQVMEQQWVKTKEATAVISINATVTDQNLVDLHQSILKNLQRIATGDWHITQFTRSKTSSGLESVSAEAQIRLPANQFDRINTHAKSVSKAGQTYSVRSLNFNPSPADIGKTQLALRAKIYRDVQMELNSLNKEFPKAHYFAHQIRFLSAPVMLRTTALVRMTGAATPAVSQQATLMAEVVLSSKVNGSSSS